MRLRVVGVVCAVALVGAVGCGGDDEESSEAAAPTKEEFIADADQICADGDAEIDAAAQETFSEGRPSAQEQEQFVQETVLPSIQEQIDGIRELTPPEGDEEAIDEFLTSADTAVDEAEQDPSVLLQGGQRQGSADDPFAETAQLAEEYGFQNCAQ
jgi:hypothetical protein